MYKLPNNNAVRAIQRVGASVVATSATGDDDDYNLDQASDALSEEQVQIYKASIESAQNDANSYLARNKNGLNWLYARWPGQWTDGRKWPLPNEQSNNIWPWPGAADTRDRTCEMVVDEEVMVGMFALQNMKVQARSARPFQMIREAQQITTLLNWQLFVLLKAEMHREMYFALNCRAIFGSAIIAAEWEQRRRLDTATISVMTLWALLGGKPNGQQRSGPRLDEVAAMLVEPSYEDGFVRLIQSLSPIVTRPEARRAVRDLQTVRQAQIKVPYVFKSQPKITALRAGVDVLFPGDTGDLQAARMTDRIERVNESELMDRIETAGYDAEFVDQALEHKGDMSNETWARYTALERQNYYVNSNTRGLAWANQGGSSTPYSDDDALVELHHCTRLQHDRGVPVLFETVLHLGVEIAGKHGPAPYAHGNRCLHVMRRDHKQRPILASEGIPEIAYTWEQELKTQADHQTDRADLALRPPMLTDSYEEQQKFKTQFMPTALIPVRRHGSFDFFKPPQYDIGSVQIMQRVQAKIDRYFGLFGPEVDPDKKKLRRGQLGNDLMVDMHPVIFQVLQLDQELLPDAEVALVVGPLSRPFHLSRKDIQGAWQIAGTIDMQTIDQDYLKNALQYGVQLASLDTMGVGDRAYLVRALAEMISPDFADNFIRDTQPATQAEQQDEERTIDLILASGQDQPFPKGGNYQLRLKTATERVQKAMQTNPVVQRRLRENPEIMQVIQSRIDGFQGQLQQQNNAQIGRDMTMQTFSKQALPREAVAGQ